MAKRANYSNTLPIDQRYYTRSYVRLCTHYDILTYMYVGYTVYEHVYMYNVHIGLYRYNHACMYK